MPTHEERILRIPDKAVEPLYTSEITKRLNLELDLSGGCTGTVMRAGTSVPMPLRYALLQAAGRPITVGFRAPDAEAYLEADGHRLLAH